MESAGGAPQDGPNSPPSRQSVFFEWVSRKPKVAFWATLGVALVIGLGLGAASVEEETGGDANLEAQLEETRDEREEAEDERSEAEDELEEVEDDLAAAQRRARSTERKLRRARRAPAVAETPSVDSSADRSGSGVQSFSGNGGKSLGTITVEEQSVLEWTNDGDIFQIFTADGVPVNSQANSGETVLAAGSHADFQVNAVGNWTITIRAR